MSETSFSAWLKNWRKKKGLSTRHVAALLQVSQTYIWKLENDKVGPSLRFLRKFAGTFQEPEVYLAAGRLIPEKELEKIRNTSNKLDKILEFFENERSTGHPLENMTDEPELAKLILDIYIKIKNTNYTTKDLDFIKNLVYSYFEAKESKKI